MINEKDKDIRGILLDYGGTLDTPAIHWSYIIWMGYKEAGVPLDESTFRDAYVYGERFLEHKKLIEETDTFYDVLSKKITIQLQSLVEKKYLSGNDKNQTVLWRDHIVDYCYEYAKETIIQNKRILDKLIEIYPIVLVTNFYGNMKTVLADFGLASYFRAVIESACVGFRKPAPTIYEMGLKALCLSPDHVLVIGDSYEKDILPAQSLGCHTAWLKGKGWIEKKVDEKIPDVICCGLPEVLDWLGI